MLGSHGFHVNPTVGIDFTVTTRPGSERLIRAAFEHAKTSGRSRVTIVTKSNIVKQPDGYFQPSQKRSRRSIRAFSVMNGTLIS